MKLIPLHQIPIYEQLKIEETLLRTDTDNWCLINTGAPPAIVMGISGKKEELLNLDEVKHQQVPIVRRYSGGGTVIVDENTIFISLIGNESLLDGPCFPEPVMRWAETLLTPLIPNLRLCENDFVIGNQKVAGNAQYIRKGRFCHHLTLLWDFSHERMACLKLPKRIPRYRGARSHAAFLTKLREHLPNKEQFLLAFENQLKVRFGSTRVPLSALEPLLSRPHRRSTELIGACHQLESPLYPREDRLSELLLSHRAGPGRPVQGEETAPRTDMRRRNGDSN